VNPDDITALFARRVREERRARKWTLQTLGEKAGVSLSVTDRAEKTGGVTLRSVLLIAEAFGVPAAELLAEPEFAAEPQA
jgi:transcriptional regulator with XRE-family HTH domain